MFAVLSAWRAPLPPRALSVTGSVAKKIPPTPGLARACLPAHTKRWSRCALARAAALALAVFCLLGGGSREAAAQYTQQGPGLAASDAVGNAGQGSSVAVSADGNTMIVGGPGDSSGAGATWVYTRSGGVWTEQAKLVGTGAVNPAGQGWSVGLSTDGNTAIVGAPEDNTENAGAVWIFTRSGGTWTQAGSKLVPSDVNSGNFGWSVALSGDGSTAAVSEPYNNSVGEVYVFTLIGGVWTQQGSPLAGTGYTTPNFCGGDGQGWSVALSYNGNTLIEGTPIDNCGYGAAWVFTRSGGAWTQAGSKLVASGVMYGSFGSSVALSGEGTFALVGSPGTSSTGAGYVFTPVGGVWTQYGSPLIGTGSSGSPDQGSAVALSLDGNTAMLGGPGDPTYGSAWIFTFSNGSWIQNGSKLSSGTSSEFGGSIALSADGSTAIAGAPTGRQGSFSDVGATFVFTAAVPTVTALSPSVGAAAGGASVTITGTNFLGAAGVQFGASSAPSFTVNSATSITVTSPAGGGTVDVTVTNAAGTSATSAADQFSYIASSAPTVTAISPASGPAAGGTSVTITGSGFDGASAVQFGATSAAAFTVNNNSQITATAPPGSDTVDVTVTEGYLTSATSAADRFTYGVAPAVTAVVPNTGSTAGGTNVTITGTNFVAGATVNFGGAAATNVSVVSATSITATSPAGSGIVDVTVTTPAGSSATGAADGFSYTANLTLVATASSTTQVGQAYRQTNVADGGTTPYTYSLSAGSLPAGTRLNPSTGTVFGRPTAAGAFNYTIEATDSGSPAQTATQPASGTIAPGPTAPTVTAVSPNGGPPAGGTTVMITGTNLTGATAVNFGGSAARQFAVNSATEISAVSPAGAVGAVDVTVTSGQGTSAASAADHFAYAAARSTQRGQKLVGSGASGAAEEAFALALTPDGNTAVLGGFADSANAGAAWVFSHSSGAWTQTGSKLVGSGATGNAEQGYSVAISGDGNTMLIGGPADNGNAGAVWVFTQSGGSWTQQGQKLTPSDEAGAGQFGIAVALSNDGNTALIGGSADNSGVGAAWVFTRTGGVWTQQNLKLTASDENGAGGFGGAVALSSAATTALIGGAGDLANTGGPSLTPLGAAWIFTQSGNVWSQEGSKLVGSGSAGAAMEGFAVALSADGNTALIGGPADNSGAGAGWVFTQSSNTWSQAGAKLTGTGATGTAQQGFAVALSADASTAVIGGDEDDSFNGAAWMFTQNGGTWTQHGAKLVGSGAVGAAQQGMALALSSNGQTLIEGGPFDSSGTGAAWAFTLGTLAASHDVNGDGVSDILWKDTSGDLALWLMSGGQESSGAMISQVPTTWGAVGTRDFNGDGDADILWLDGSGDLALWLMNGTSVSSYASLGNVGTQWTVAGTGDFNGDGTGDILWRNGSTGDTAIWLMRNGALSSGVDLGAVPAIWQVAGTGDFNGDGTTDILWRNTANGELAIWFMSNGRMSSSLNVGRVSTDWSVVGTGDFNGDGVSDILWRDSEGDLAIWLMNSSGQEASGTTFAGIPTTWSVAETGDFNGDGYSDILWIDGSGDLGVWLMNGLSVSSAIGLGNVGASWKVQGQNAD